jgi:hypothetical protein
MATTITAGNATNGAAISSDSTGILELKSGTGSGTTAVTVGTGQAVTFAQAANLPNTFGFKNRIINGNMVIDQRNAGAAVTLTALAAATGYGADRWYAENFTDGTATIQQITDAPTGFSNSIRYTVTATDSSLASDQSAFIQQRIEGFNSADLAFGSASAQTITLSFWVKSSVTGTFGGALANNAYNRGYPFTFTISAANTWEQKSITIAGDTTGTWVGSTNGVGLRVTFALAAGSARVSTAGVWAAYVGIGASGQVNLMATNSATFQVTGVQLEKGSTATSFDVRPYGTELQLCQRYYYRVSTGTTSGFLSSSGQWYSSTVGGVITTFPVTMRTRPTALEQSGTANHYAMVSSVGGGIACSAVPTYGGDTREYLAVTNFTTASGGVAGYMTNMYSNNASAYLGWSAEL